MRVNKLIRLYHDHKYFVNFHHDASQQADRPIHERRAGVMNAAATMPLGFMQKK